MKIVTGNPGKRKLNKAEPQFNPEIPLCPEWIDDEGKREWMRVVGDLHKAGLCASVYAGPLAVYCQAFADFRSAVETIRHEKATLMTDKGNVIQHPAVGMKNKAMVILLKAAAEFGFSPSAKTRINSPEQDGKDELSDFLDQKSA